MPARDLFAAGVVFVAVLVFVPPARLLAWLILRGLVGGVLALVAELVERRRARITRPPPAPRRELPTVRRWRVRLSTRINGQLVTLVDGEVTGPWLDAAAVRAEALTRWAEVTGQPAGRVYCQAWPLAPATRPIGQR